MSLMNFSIPFAGLAQSVQSWGATISPLHSVQQLATNTNNLLYAPADHQQQDDGELPPPESDYYKNNPYAPPQLHQQPRRQQTYQYNVGTGTGNTRRKGGNTYLPPIPPPGVARINPFHQHHLQQQQQQQHQQQQHLQHQQQHHFSQQHIGKSNIGYKTESISSSSASVATNTRTYGEGSYNRFPVSTSSITTSEPVNKQYHHQHSLSQEQQKPQPKQFVNSFSSSQNRVSNTATSFRTQQTAINENGSTDQVATPALTYGSGPGSVDGSIDVAPDLHDGQQKDRVNTGNEVVSNADDLFPERPPGFTRVQAGQGSRTQVHAVLDYDEEEGEEEDYQDANGQRTRTDGSSKSSMPTVTPIQGPIFLKNGTVPVVPLFSYPTLNNGSFVQIPIWWTALSVALGLDVRGDIIKGVPCIKRYHQLFCPTAGNSYPIDKIERFIDDNKALMRRMYGDFEMNMDSGGPRSEGKTRRRRFIDEPDIFIPPGAHPAFAADGKISPHDEEVGDSYFGKLRNKRQSGNQSRNNNKNGPSFGQNGPGNPGSTGPSSTGRLDACESKIEIVTPYWASNSAGKIRAIVNTQHFEQAIHQEVCTKSQTPRCERDCGCEQKYKWHRLLAYDPDNDCKGIFMDWFLFPSCCVCRCNP